MPFLSLQAPKRGWRRGVQHASVAARLGKKTQYARLTAARLLLLPAARLAAGALPGGPGAAAPTAAACCAAGLAAVQPLQHFEVPQNAPLFLQIHSSKRRHVSILGASAAACRLGRLAAHDSWCRCLRSCLAARRRHACLR